MMLGKVGRDVDTEAGYEAARLCGQCHLSTLQGALGSLDKVTPCPVHTSVRCVSLHHVDVRCFALAGSRTDGADFRSSAW
jgi:hypothetical protein